MAINSLDRSRSLTKPAFLVSLVIFIETISVGLLVGHGDFLADDFINFDQAKQSALTWPYLSQSVFGHFIPLFRLTNFVIMRTFPFHYWVISLLISMIYAALLISMYRLITLLTGQSYWAVLMIGLLGTSLTFLPELLWWSNGLSSLVTAWLNIVVLSAFLRYQLDGRRIHAAVSVGAFTIGLGFFDSMSIVVLELLLFIVLFLSDSLRIQAMIIAITCRWRLLVAYLVPLAADLSYRYVNSTRYSLPQPPTLLISVRYIEIAWSQGFILGTLGFLYPTRLLLDSKGLTIAVGQVMFAVLVISSIRRQRRSWRVWTFFIAIIAVIFEVTAYARAGAFGPNLGLDFDYFSFLPSLLIFSVVLAFSPAALNQVFHSSQGPVASRLPSKEPTLPSGRTLTITIFLVSVYLITLVPSATYILRNSGEYASRQYFTNVGKSITDASRRHSPLFLFNGSVPYAVVPSVFAPFNSYANSVGMLFPLIKINSGVGNGYLISSSGVLVPSHFVPSAILSTGLLHRMHFCITTRNVPRKRILTTTTSLSSGAWMLKISYSTSRNVVATLVFFDGTTAVPAVGQKGAINLLSGTRSSFLNLNAGTPNKLAFIIPPHGHVCVLGAQIGQPAPLRASADR